MAPISGYVIPIINQKPGYLHFNWHFYVKEVIDTFCLWHYVSETVPIPYLYKLTPLFIDFSKTNHSTFQLKARSFEWKVPFLSQDFLEVDSFHFLRFFYKNAFLFLFYIKTIRTIPGQDRKKTFFKMGIPGLFFFISYFEYSWQ